MYLKRFFLLMIVYAVTMPGHAASCVYMPGNNVVTGDTALGPLACRQTYINYFWSAYDFHKGDWDNGFGYHDACNINKPLARTFNALYVLHYSATSTAPMLVDPVNYILRTSGSYANGKIDELDGRCGNGMTSGTSATTQWGPIIDNWTQLKWPFFYGKTVVARAGTLYHEARHADWVGHNGGDRCPRGSSCDNRWEDNGANTFQVRWLSAFAQKGREWTPTMRAQAIDTANNIIDRGFVVRPNFHVN